MSACWESGSWRGNAAYAEEEPVAYLASGTEINGDATNYWTFSPAGLRRILQRTRWAILGEAHLGCLSKGLPWICMCRRRR